MEALFLEQIATGGTERPYLFLEYVDGPTLGDAIVDEGRLAIPVAVDVATGIAWGMAHAHGVTRTGPRIVHRDLKPENVFLTRHRVTKVSDFGIARALDRPDGVVGEGLGAGTPFYAAPEQLRDAQRADVRSDVYAFGALVHHALTGQLPFPATTLSQLVWRVLRERPPLVSTLREDAPAGLESLVAACLERDPADRPSDFGVVLRELSELREDAALWVAAEGALSCPSCGWQTVTPREQCSICGHATEDAIRYAPTSRRSPAATPTLGRTGSGEIHIEGLEIRPRTPAPGDRILLTLLLGNSGRDAVEQVVVPYRAPDPNAFERPPGFRSGFRGSVSPTAQGAPLRVSWNVRALREGTFKMPAPRAWYRDESGARVIVRGEPLRVTVAGENRLPLIGRAGERATLLELLEQARSGPAAAFVLGPLGSGKTRMGRELRRTAEGSGFRAVRGRSLARGADVRGALREGLRRLLRPETAPRNEAGVTAELVSVLGGAVRGESELLDFLTAELRGRELPRGESPAQMWARLAVRLARQRPFLLVLEDVERDMEVARIALAMLRAAAAEGVPLFLVMTARETVEHDTAAAEIRGLVEQEAARGTPVRVVRLGPLGGEAVRELVDAALSPNDFPTSAPWLYDEIDRISGGNPLFVGELVRGLRTARRAGEPLLATRAGRWTAATYFRPEVLREIVPPGAEALIVRRLDHLSAPAQRLARVAATLGDATDAEIVRGAYGDDATVDEALSVLEREGVLRETGGARLRIRFREPMLPEMLARMTRVDEADLYRDVHAHAARAFEAKPSAAGRDALRLARHLEGAGRHDDAFEAYLRAAQRLGRRQAFGRAHRAVSAADALVEDRHVRPTRRQRTRLLMQRGESLRFAGDLQGAKRAYTQVIDESPAHRPERGVLATAHTKLGRVLASLGRDEDALYAYAVGLTLREQRGLRDEVALSLVHLAGLHQRRGEVVLAASYLERAEEASRSSENRRALGRAYALRGRLAAAAGRTAEARAHSREALRIARDANDRIAGADAYAVLSAANLRDGRTTRALRWGLRALARRQEIGDLAAVGTAWREVGKAHEALDHRADALSAYERAGIIHRRIGDRRGVARALASRGRLELDAGMPARATETLARAAQSLDEEGDPAGAASALAHGARAAVLRGAREEGSDPGTLLARAEAAAEGVEDGESATAIVLARLEITRAAGPPAAVLAAAHDGLTDPRVNPRARVELLSTTAELSGDRDRADAALALATRGGRPRSLSRALSACARVALDQGRREDARPLLRRAVGLLRASGARDPLFLRLLRDLAAVEEGGDHVSATAARRLADDLEAELIRRGYAPPSLRRGPDGPSAAKAPSGSMPALADEGASTGMEQSHTIQLPSDLSGVPVVREGFESACLAEGVDGEELDLWKLVFTELLNNAIEHGCDEHADQIVLQYSISDRAVELRVQDPGSYDPALRLLFDKKETNFAETGRGVGLLLVREFMDEIDVQPIEGGTEIRVRRARRSFRSGEGA